MLLPLFVSVDSGLRPNMIPTNTTQTNMRYMVGPRHVTPHTHAKKTQKKQTHTHTKHTKITFLHALKSPCSRMILPRAQTSRYLDGSPPSVTRMFYPYERPESTGVSKVFP